MRKSLSYIIMVFIVTLLYACDMDTVYYHYEHTPIQGWEKNDTLSFDIGPIDRPGMYDANIGLRINGSFPFTRLALIVETKIYPRQQVITDTVMCNLTSKRGVSSRHGISYSQYTSPAGEITLSPGDSLHVSIRHCMKRDILPGISDIGIHLKHKHQ